MHSPYSLKDLPPSFFCSWTKLLREVTAKDSALIDLRSPKEFSLGSIPGALNLPLLDNDERHQIGLIYKQQGKEAATQQGLELFALKAANFRSQLEASVGAKRQVILYCWRGGMRSRLVGLWLASMGMQVKLVQGGYKGFRQEVRSQLQQLAAHRLLVLNGRTGAGKTDLLLALKEEGLPVIDFEGLAQHRGSAFGAIGQSACSPTQQDFENRLAEQYLFYQDCPVILVEIENFIGPISLGKSLRKAITSAPMVFVARDFDDRVERLASTYTKSWDAAGEKLFVERMELLQKFLARSDYERILQAAVERNFCEVIASLLRLRYDKAYDKSLQRHQRQVVADFNLTHQEEEAKQYLRSYLAPAAGG